MPNGYSYAESPWSIALQQFVNTALPIYTARQQAKTEAEQAEVERLWELTQERRQQMFNLAKSIVEREAEAKEVAEKRRWEAEVPLGETLTGRLRMLEHQHTLEEIAKRNFETRKTYREFGAPGARGGDEEEKFPLNLNQALGKLDSWQKQYDDWETYQTEPEIWRGKVPPKKPRPLSTNVIKVLEAHNEPIPEEAYPEVPTTKLGEPKPRRLNVMQAYREIVASDRSPQMIRRILLNHGLLLEGEVIDPEVEALLRANGWIR